MQINPRAIDLVWDDTNVAVFGKTFFSILKSKSYGLFTVDNYGNYRLINSFNTIDEAKIFAQQWANELVASIAKPFEVPDIRDSSGIIQTIIDHNLHPSNPMSIGEWVNNIGGENAEKTDI